MPGLIRMESTSNTIGMLSHPIFYNSCHLGAAAAAFAPENQHPGADPGRNIGDSCHIIALGAPDGIKNFELSISGHGFPDSSGAGGEVIACFKKSSFNGIFLPNQTFTDFAVKQTGLNNLSFTEIARIHYGGRRHRHIPGGAATLTEFSFHAIHRCVLEVFSKSASGEF